MDLRKSYEFFQPEMLDGRVHIIGCGAVGSTIAENLCRFGITKMTLWDFDTVEAHNVANQMFRGVDIGKPKVVALADYLCEINPEIKDDLKLMPDGWHGQRLAGYVFLAVDSIDLRREIVEKFKDSTYIKAMFDFRMALLDGQHYAADWKDSKMVEDFLNSMQFTHEEAHAEETLSACNIPMSVVPTVRLLVALGVSNFINFVKDGVIKKMAMSNAFDFSVMAF